MKNIKVTVNNDGKKVSTEEQRVIIDKVMELKNLLGAKIQVSFI